MNSDDDPSWRYQGPDFISMAQHAISEPYFLSLRDTSPHYLQLTCNNSFRSIPGTSAIVGLDVGPHASADVQALRGRADVPHASTSGVLYLHTVRPLPSGSASSPNTDHRDAPGPPSSVLGLPLPENDGDASDLDTPCVKGCVMALEDECACRTGYTGVQTISAA